MRSWCAPARTPRERLDTDPEVASAVVEEVSAANPSRSIALEVEGDVRGSFDADRAAQLLSNLDANAVTYAPPDGRIVVRVAGNAPGVELSVENGGAPIPAAERAGLFAPFPRRTRPGPAPRPGPGPALGPHHPRPPGRAIQL